MSEIVELKPCPFCGDDDKMTIAPGLVGCERCDYHVAPEDWLTRPIEDALRAEVERLRAALDKYTRMYRESQGSLIWEYSGNVIDDEDGMVRGVNADRLNAGLPALIDDEATGGA